MAKIRAMISQMEDKIEIPAITRFFFLSKSVSEQTIVSFEQFLQELLNFKGEHCTYFSIYWNPIYLKIFPHLLYLKRIKRYVHSVKFHCEKKRKLIFYPWPPPLPSRLNTKKIRRWKISHPRKKVPSNVIWSLIEACFFV